MRSLQLLVLAAAMAVASAQYQTGILYWCNYREPLAALAGSPRSLVSGSSFALACSVTSTPTPAGPLTYSNGTAYPGNNASAASATYDVHPTGCFVSSGNVLVCDFLGGGRDISIGRWRRVCLSI